MKVLVNEKVIMSGFGMDVARLLEALGIQHVDGIHYSTTKNCDMCMSKMHTYHVRNSLWKMVCDEVVWLCDVIEKFSLFGTKAHLANMTNNDFYEMMLNFVGLVKNEEFVWILGELESRLELEGEDMGQCHKR